MHRDHRVTLYLYENVCVLRVRRWALFSWGHILILKGMTGVNMIGYDSPTANQTLQIFFITIIIPNPNLFVH